MNGSITRTRTGHRVVVRSLAASPDEALERMVLEPMDAPDPAGLAPREVVVEVRSASVGFVDLIMASGQYQHAVTPPYTPGLESAGVVTAVGEAVPGGVAPGDRVLVDGLLAGPRSHGAYAGAGGWASWVVVPVEAVRRIPDALSFDQACNLLGSYETAWHALVARGRVRAGETVLILGASGATGLAAVHLCRRLGARSIAAGRSPDKLARVAAEGADHVVITGTADGVHRFRDDVKALTGGRGVDVVWDGVGGDTTLEALRCLRFGGRLLLVGWASTPDVADGEGRRGAPRANHLPTNLLLIKGLDVLGCPAVISLLHDPSLRPPRLAAIEAWAASGELRPVVSGGWPLTEFRTALRARWRGEAVGGTVLRP